MAFKKHINRKQKLAQRKRSNIPLILLFFILIVYKKNASSYKTKSIYHSISESIPLILTKSPLYSNAPNNLKIKSHKSVNHVAAIIQLILFNDIHPNPGPEPNMVIFKCIDREGVRKLLKKC